MLKDDYKIDVIYIQYGLDKYFNIVNDKETLYGLSNWRLLIETFFQEIAKKSKYNIMSKFFDALVMLMKIIGRMQNIMFFPNNLRWFYRKAYKTLCTIHKENPIDVVFTVNSPFSAHLAGELFKKKFNDVRWVAYTVDPYHVGYKDNIFSIFNNTKKALRIECEILSKADMNLLSEEIYENCKIMYETINDKVNVLPYLIEFNNLKDEHIFDCKKINLVYAGRFYREIRNPEYLLQTFLSLQSADIILHLYSTSDCECLINDYVNKSEGRIIRHQVVDSLEIKKVYASADFLVNLGNSILEFKPSKTFEYISTGKPIIHFYRNGIIDEDLMRYPFSLQVDEQNEISVNKIKINDFILLHKGKRITKNEIIQNYYEHSTGYIKYIVYNSFNS